MVKRVCQYLNLKSRSIDLRFKRDLEVAYQAHVEDRLMKSCMVCLSTWGLVVLAMMVAIALDQFNRDDNPMEFTHHDPRLFSFLCAAGVVVMDFLCVSLCFARIRWNMFGKMDMEQVVTGFMLVSILVAMLTRTYTSCALYGVDDDYVWGEDTSSHEAFFILCMDVIISGTHLFLPIRTCRVWTLDAAIVGGLALHLAFFGGPFSVKWSVGLLVNLAVLAAFAFMGSWHFESNSRKRWKAEGQVVLKQTELNKQQEAVAHILERLCDSLVTVSSTFELVSPSPRFAAWLLCGTELRSSSFLHYLATEEDEYRFTESLQNNRRDGVVTVTLRDIYGRCMPVTAHHTCFQDNGQTFHLIGLVESGERLRESKFNDLQLEDEVPILFPFGQASDSNQFRPPGDDNRIARNEAHVSEDSSGQTASESDIFIRMWTMSGLYALHQGGTNVVVNVLDKTLNIKTVLSSDGTQLSLIEAGTSLEQLLVSVRELSDGITKLSMDWVNSQRQQFPIHLGAFDVQPHLCKTARLVVQVIRFYWLELDGSLWAFLSLQLVRVTPSQLVVERPVTNRENSLAMTSL